MAGPLTPRPWTPYSGFSLICFFAPSPLRPFAPSPLRPFAPSPLRPFAPSPLRPFAPSPLRPFAPSPLRPFAPSPLRPFAPSPLRPFAPSPLRPFAPSPLRPFAPSPLRLFVPSINMRGFFIDFFECALNDTLTVKPGVVSPGNTLSETKILDLYLRRRVFLNLCRPLSTSQKAQNKTLEQKKNIFFNRHSNPHGNNERFLLA